MELWFGQFVVKELLFCYYVQFNAKNTILVLKTALPFVPAALICEFYFVWMCVTIQNTQHKNYEIALAFTLNQNPK